MKYLFSFVYRVYKILVQMLTSCLHYSTYRLSTNLFVHNKWLCTQYMGFSLVILECDLIINCNLKVMFVIEEKTIHCSISGRYLDFSITVGILSIDYLHTTDYWLDSLIGFQYTLLIGITKAVNHCISVYTSDWNFQFIHWLIYNDKFIHWLILNGLHYWFVLMKVIHWLDFSVDHLLKKKERIH